MLISVIFISCKLVLCTCVCVCGGGGGGRLNIVTIHIHTYTHTHRYKEVIPQQLSQLDPRTFSEALFRAVGMGLNEFCFGMTKVFFKAGKVTSTCMCIHVCTYMHAWGMGMRHENVDV